MNASLLQLAATGYLGPIRIGTSIDAILARIGEPCWHDSNDARNPNGYWRVGNAELFFMQGLLHHGWCQEAQLNYLGPRLSIDSSGIEYRMQPDRLHAILDSNGISWFEVPCEDGGYEYMIETSSGVQFFFHRIDDELTGGDGLKMWVLPAADDNSILG